MQHTANVLSGKPDRRFESFRLRRQGSVIERRLTVCATFALGTAAGDMFAFTLNLGFLTAGLVFAALIALVATLHYAAKGWMSEHHEHMTRNAVLAFWLAYILTRPLGASFADWFGKSPSIGGLGWGDGVVSSILTILLIGFVWYL